MDMYPTFSKLAAVPLSAAGEKFLASRGVPKELAIKFGIGSVGRISITNPLLFETEREAVWSAEKFVNAARGSLVTPLYTLSGDAISIQLRSLTAQRSFHFVHTPYGSFYDPLFGAYQQQCLLLKSRAVILTESVLDTLSVLAAEPRCPVLSALSSRLSQRHLDWLSRFINRVCILYDHDQAGLDGTRKAREKLESRGIKVIVPRYSGKDPNDLLTRYGLSTMQRLVREISLWAAV